MLWKHWWKRDAKCTQQIQAKPETRWWKQTRPSQGRRRGVQCRAPQLGGTSNNNVIGCGGAMVEGPLAVVASRLRGKPEAEEVGIWMKRRATGWLWDPRRTLTGRVVLSSRGGCSANWTKWHPHYRPNLLAEEPETRLRSPSWVLEQDWRLKAATVVGVATGSLMLTWNTIQILLGRWFHIFHKIYKTRVLVIPVSQK